MSEEQAAAQNEEAAENATQEAEEADADAAEGEGEDELTEEEKLAAAKAAEEKVVCYLSKQSVPISDTVEVKYNDEGVFRVQRHLVKF